MMSQHYLKVIAIGGIPASGKTRLMRSVMESLKKKKALGFDFASGLIHGTQYPAARTIIVGKYQGDEVFAGTDKLSMAVQPVFLRWIRETLRPEGYYRYILFEGDRLFNASLFEALQKDGVAFDIIILDVRESVQKERFIERGSTQPEKFLKAKRTKVDNIRNQYSDKHEYWTNESAADLIYNTNRILDFYSAPF